MPSSPRGKTCRLGCGRWGEPFTTCTVVTFMQNYNVMQTTVHSGRVKDARPDPKDHSGAFFRTARENAPSLHTPPRARRSWKDGRRRPTHHRGRSRRALLRSMPGERRRASDRRPRRRRPPRHDGIVGRPIRREDRRPSAVRPSPRGRLAPRERRLLRRRRRVPRDPRRPVPRRDRLGRPMRRGRRAQVARPRRVLVAGDVAGGAPVAGGARRGLRPAPDDRREDDAPPRTGPERPDARPARGEHGGRQGRRPASIHERVGLLRRLLRASLSRGESREGATREDFRRRRRLASPALAPERGAGDAGVEPGPGDGGGDVPGVRRRRR